MFLLSQPQHVSAKTGHRQLMLEKYTNDEAILQIYNANVNLLVKF
jgi:hypothetical protein